MDITVKKLPESQAEITVVLPWEEWKKEIEHAIKEMGASVKLPGFRPGNVPRDVLEKRLGKAAILQEAAEHAIRHSYAEALKKEKIDAIGEPQVKLENLIEGEPMEYRITTAVMPEVSLGDFKKAVQAINEAWKKTTDEVSEQDIANELKRLAEMRAPTVTVRRAAEKGDAVRVDFSVRRDGVPIENGTSKDHALVLGTGAFIPGFEDHLLGMSEGEEKTFSLKFPATYHAKELAGQEAEFDVKMKLVQERQIPVLDDAFAKTLGNFESLEKVKESLRQGMADEKKAKRREERRGKILDVLVEGATIEMPAVLIREETNRMFREFENRTKSLGMDTEAMLAQAGKKREDLDREWLPEAKKRIAANLILVHLAEQEEIRVESSEVEKEMNKTLGMYQSEAEAKKIDMARLYQAVQEHLRNDKALEWLESL